MALSTLPLTGMLAAEFLARPEEAWGRNNDELIEGALVMNPSPTFRHQRVVQNLVRELEDWAEQTGAGEVVAAVDVVLSASTVLIPDIAFVRTSRREIIAETINGPPDLVVEVLSPSTRRRDLAKKRELYAEAGVGEYWLVDPDLRAVEVLVRRGKGYRTIGAVKGNRSVTSPLLGEHRIPLGRIFRKI